MDRLERTLLKSTDNRRLNYCKPTKIYRTKIQEIQEVQEFVYLPLKGESLKKYYLSPYPLSVLNFLPRTYT